MNDALLIYRGDDLSDAAAVLHRLDGAADGVADPPDDAGERTLLSVVVVVPKIAVTEDIEGIMECLG